MAIEGCEMGPATKPVAKVGLRKRTVVVSKKVAPKVALGKAEALRKALAQAKKPLGLGEVVEGMKRIGYKFQSADPKNAMHHLLYGKNRADFVAKTDAGFSLKK